MDWTPFTVKEVEFITPNTGIFRFALPDGKERLGMTTASFLMTRVKVGDKPDGTPDYAIRPYTPVSEDGHGYFDLIVKKYPTGVLSSHIHSLKPGDKLEFKGPLVKFVYKPNEIPQITMIAGGSGITPMIQVAREVLSNPNDKTHVNLLFANQTEDDIICRDLLDAWAARYKDRFHLYYTLDKAPEGWKQGKGFITEEMLAGKLPAPGSGGRVLVCGPPGMMKHVSGDKAPDKSQGELSGLLKKMGYTEAEVG
ncbi:hypothetical protein DFJ74DRAFT_613972 [Hyaloraphidium curvatum]|nr:hypothetical protein DFJ74DRAFT_613972 [Hyaloraphidium curvatum]